MDGQTPFGDWLRQRRHLLDLTQAALAAQCGCSAVTIRKLEAGERKPSPELALSLAASLRLPEREWPAFVQFARSDEQEAVYRLPAWEASQPAWRGGQLPGHPPEATDTAAGIRLQYELVAPAPPRQTKLRDGRLHLQLAAHGPVSGDVEGAMALRLTQIIVPKPPDAGYPQALPMQLAAHFVIRSGDEAIEGTYAGTISPMLDAAGGGHARVQGTGMIVAVTPGFADLFLHYVFVDDEVKMVEGTGTGARGVMRLRPPAR